jgi:ABC-type lipoprotein release transport system permease subunit
MVSIGLALGLMGASLSSRLFQRLLFNINPLDPVAYVGAAVLCFGSVAPAACLLPAWRATRINPVSQPFAGSYVGHCRPRPAGVPKLSSE